MDRLPIDLQEYVIESCMSMVDLVRLRQVSKFFRYSRVLIGQMRKVVHLICQQVDKIPRTFLYGMETELIDASYLINSIGSIQQLDRFFYSRFMNCLLEFDNPSGSIQLQCKFFQVASHFPQELYLFLSTCPNIDTLARIFQRHFADVRQKPIYGYLCKSYNLKEFEIDNSVLDNPISYVKNAIDYLISWNTFYVLNFPRETMRAFLFPLLRRNAASLAMLLRIPMKPELLKTLLLNH
jgi:hypothetical protein